MITAQTGNEESTKIFLTKKLIPRKEGTGARTKEDRMSTMMYEEAKVEMKMTHRGLIRSDRGEIADQKERITFTRALSMREVKENGMVLVLVKVDQGISGERELVAIVELGEARNILWEMLTEEAKVETLKMRYPNLGECNNKEEGRPTEVKILVSGRKWVLINELLNEYGVMAYNYESGEII